MTKPRKAGLLFAVGLAVLAALRGISGAQQPTGGAITNYRAIYENVSGTLGQFRINTAGAFYAVFGSSGGVAGAVLTSSGTVVIQSTSTLSTNPILQIRNAAGTVLGNWLQNGNLQLVTGQFLGDGSALSGLPGINAVITWTNSQYFAKDVNISSATSSLVVGSSATFNGTTYLGSISSATFGSSSVNQNQATNTNGTLLFSASYSSTTVGQITGAYATTFASCVTSTITIVSHGNPIIINFTGNGAPGAAAIDVPVLLMDGNFVGKEATSTGTGFTSQNSSFGTSFGLVNYMVTPAAGKHSFCLGFIANTGASATLCSTLGATVSVEGCQFSAYELH